MPGDISNFKIAVRIDRAMYVDANEIRSFWETVHTDYIHSRDSVIRSRWRVQRNSNQTSSVYDVFGVRSHPEFDGGISDFRKNTYEL